MEYASMKDTSHNRRPGRRTARQGRPGAVADELTRLRSAVDAMDEGFQVISFDWRYVYVNAAAAQHSHRSREELIGRTMIESYPGIEQTEMFRVLKRCMEERRPAAMENEFVYPDGKIGWFELRIQPSAEGISVLSVDVSDRKRAEEALRTSEAHYRTILEHIGDAVVITTPDGHYLDVNPQACAMTGYDREELLRLGAVDTYPLEEREAAAARAAEVASGRSIVFDRRLLRKDGTVILVEINARPLPDGRLLAAMRDITERRNLENQLRQAQKMEAVGRLAGGLAHDFNNVLTAVFGYVDLLSEELAPGSHAREDVEEIRRAAERAAALTRQLLAFSRQQVLDPIVLSVNDLIRNLDKMLRRLIGEDVDLRLNLAPDVGNVRADPGQLEQVIANLVVNARDAMPEGGKLLIETVNADLTEQYADMHRPVMAGAYVMIAVSDTGVGMDEATKARIFEPFFTTKEKGRGTGLGLSTVYGIVKQSGGYIWAYSEVGRGTTFKVYLPRVDALAAQVAAPREAGTLTGSETVLLAEDDPMLRPLAKTLLQKLGYTVLEAENADQAVALAAAHPAPIHLLVADVVMPGASGRELARRLAASRPDMKVLYVSGYTDDAIVHHGMLEPGLSFLQKPFTPAALARKVRDVLDSTYPAKKEG